MTTLIKTKVHDDFLQMVERADLADSTKAQYAKAVLNALNAGVNLSNADQLIQYSGTINKSSRSFLKAAIRLWGRQVELQAKAGATPENVAVVTATMYRLEALANSLHVETEKGKKAHSWLTKNEVKLMLAGYDTSTVKGQRDRLLVGLLVGAGLRREELTTLTFDDVVVQPIAGRERTVLNVKGKGAKDRIVPVSDKLASAIEQWQAVVNGGLIARSMTKGGKIGQSLSSVGLFKLVTKAGNSIDKPGLAPHDLRRTFAQLGYEAGVKMTQISTLLGHSSIVTTQRYLNLEVDMACTISDFIPF